MTGFKQEGFFYKLEDIQNNTLDLTDIINNSTYNATRSLMYHEPVAQQIGRCYSLKNETGYKINQGLELSFKTNYDLKIYIHQKGDELWLAGFQEFPLEVASVIIDIKKQQNCSLGMLALKEIRSVHHSKAEKHCIDYADGSVMERELFANCCKENIWRILSTDINCTIAEMEQIIPRNTTMKKCDERNEAKMVYWKFTFLLEKIYLQPWNYGCFVPCKQTSYTFKVNYFHKNNVLMPDNKANNSKDHLYMYVYFPTFSVEEKIESLEYDLANLLVSAGGNLGLFMGLSCLSVLFYAIDCLQTILLAKFS